MQKSLTKFLAIAFSIAILFSSCSKAPDKVLPKKGGAWTITYNDVTTVGGASSTQTGAYAAVFSDATFTISQLGVSVTYGWSYDKKNKTVTITYAGLGSQTYNVEEMKAKSEKWTLHTSSTSGGVTTVEDQTWTFTKI